MNSREFPNKRTGARQRGTAAVEFALIATLFFLLLLGVVELGRLFYVFNTVQEVTRCAARQAVVNWDDKWPGITKECVFQKGASQNEVWLVAGREISNLNIKIRFLHAPGLVPTPDGSDQVPTNAAANIVACAPKTLKSNCIRYVEAKVCNGNNCDPIQYQPMFGLFPRLNIDIPAATVLMPAESLGYGM